MDVIALSFHDIAVEAALMLNYRFGKSRRTDCCVAPMPSVSGSMPFVPVRLGVYSCVDDYYTERSELPECLLIYTLSGRGRIRYRGEEKVLSGGDMVVINCAHYQYYATEKNCRWDFMWLHFAGACAGAYVDEINARGLSVARGDFESRLRVLFSTVRLRDADSFFAAGLDLHKLLRLLQLSSPGRGGKPAEAVRRAADYIEAHYRRNLTLDELASAAALSKYYFLRLFSKEIGVPPYEYLLRFRVEKARELLSETPMSVDEISRETGFCDAKNLIAHFRKRTGMTPLSYRRSLPFRQMPESKDQEM